MLSMTLLIIVLMALLSFVLARSRSMAVVKGELAELHSLPSYHGSYSALLTAIAGVVVAVGLFLAFDKFIESQLYAALPESYLQQDTLHKDRLIEDAKALARGCHRFQLVERSGIGCQAEGAWRLRLLEPFA